MTKLENKFSEKVRKAFKAADCEVTQIMEAGCPGPADLVIEWDAVFVWLELKVDSDLRTEQGQFLKRHWTRFGNAYLLKHDLDDGYFKLWRGNEPLEEGQELWADKYLDAPEMKEAMGRALNGQLHRAQDRWAMFQ